MFRRWRIFSFPAMPNTEGAMIEMHALIRSKVKSALFNEELGNANPHCRLPALLFSAWSPFSYRKHSAKDSIPTILAVQGSSPPRIRPTVTFGPSLGSGNSLL